MPVLVCITIDISEAMPNEICRPFLQGEHVTCHIAVAWNGIWTDMMSGGRTNFMRYGKGPHGLIVTTVKPNKRKVQYRMDNAVTLTIRKVQ